MATVFEDGVESEGGLSVADGVDHDEAIRLEGYFITGLILDGDAEYVPPRQPNNTFDAVGRITHVDCVDGKRTVFRNASVVSIGGNVGLILPAKPAATGQRKKRRYQYHDQAALHSESPRVRSVSVRFEVFHATPH